MAATLTLASGTKRIKGGGTITYKGNVSRCIWWELVGVSAGVEGTAYGSIQNLTKVTDTSGFATAVYIAPIVALAANQWDRIKVHESQAV